MEFRANHAYVCGEYIHFNLSEYYTLVVAVLVAVLMMRKCQNKPATSKAQNPLTEEPEGMYEMVDTVKTAEAGYEVVDNKQQEVVLEDNPALCHAFPHTITTCSMQACKHATCRRSSVCCI